MLRRIFTAIAIACLDFELWWNERNYNRWSRWHNYPAILNAAIYRFVQPRSGHTFGTHDSR